MLGNGRLVNPEDPGDPFLAQAAEIVKLEALFLAGGKMLIHRFPDLSHLGSDKGRPPLLSLLLGPPPPLFFSPLIASSNTLVIDHEWLHTPLSYNHFSSRRF